MVMDTTLLAAFDAPGVDPYAQQQAGQLLSQQSYAPQQIQPPSLSGGAGMAEGIPQTYFGDPYGQPAPTYAGTQNYYQDPMAIQYAQDQGQFDVSNYYGMGQSQGNSYQNPMNQSALTWGPELGLPVTQNEDPWIAEQYAVLDRAYAAEQQGYLAREQAGIDERVRQDLAGQGFTFNPDGTITAPPNYNLSQEDFRAGVDRAYERAMGGVQDFNVPSLDQAFQQYAQDKSQYDLRRVNPATPAFTPEGQGGVLGFLGKAANAVGDAAGFVGDLPVLPGKFGSRSTTVGNVAGNAGDLYNTDIPIYSDFARDYIRPVASQTANAMLPGARLIGDALPILPSPGQLAEASVPVTAGDVALELLPGVGTVPDAIRLAQRVAPDLADFARVGREGLEQFAKGQFSPNVGELGAIGGVPNPQYNDAVKAINEAMAAAKARGEDVKPYIDQLKALPSQFPSAAPSPNAMTPESIAAISRRQKGGIEKPIFEGISPEEAADLASLNRMVEQGTANPARYVTKSTGEQVAPSPENIQEAVQRVLDRRSPTKIELDAKALSDDPAKFGQDLVDKLLKSKTRGGAALLKGVTPEEVQQAIMGMGDNLEVIITPRGKVGVQSKPVQESLEQLAAKADAGDLPPPPTPTTTAKAGFDPWNAFLQAWNLPRSLLASMDFSYPLRQGGLLIRHGNEWRKAFGAGMHALVDDAYAKSVMDEIGTVERPNLHISPLEGGLTAREEEFVSNWLTKIPGFRRGAQANTVFINKLRADVYDKVASSRAWTGADDATKKALANYINRATGRGTLGDFEQASTALATGLFSPRMLMSRPQFLGYLFHKNSLVRNEAWKDATAFVSGISSLLWLAQESGMGTVEMDPRSADFGKIKIGDTRVDLWTGYQQIARLIATIKTGERLSQAGDVYKIKPEDAIVQFLRSKLNPTAGAIVDWRVGKDLIGQDVDWTRMKNIGGVPVPAELVERLAPLAYQSIYDAVRTGEPLQIAASLTGLFGAGAQTYPPSKELQAEDVLAKSGLNFVDPTTGQPITDLDELDSGMRDQLRDVPGYAELYPPDPALQERYDAAWKTFQETGDIGRYRTTVDKIKASAEYSGTGQIEGAWNKKLNEFWATVGAEDDPVKSAKLFKDFEAQLNPAEKEAFNKVLTASIDPNYQRIKESDKQVQPYYDYREAQYQQLRASKPVLSQYETYTDIFEKAPTAIQNDVRQYMSDRTQVWRRDNPQQDALLYILGRAPDVITKAARDEAARIIQEWGLNKPLPTPKSKQ